MRRGFGYGRWHAEDLGLNASARRMQRGAVTGADARGTLPGGRRRVMRDGHLYGSAANVWRQRRAKRVRCTPGLGRAFVFAGASRIGTDEDADGRAAGCEENLKCASETD